MYSVLCILRCVNAYAYVYVNATVYVFVYVDTCLRMCMSVYRGCMQRKRIGEYRAIIHFSLGFSMK